MPDKGNARYPIEVDGRNPTEETKAKRERKELTPKQAKALKYYLNGDNKTTAYRKAGYKAKGTAVDSVQANAIFKKPTLRRELDLAMEKAGLTTQALADDLKMAVIEGRKNLGKTSNAATFLKAVEMGFKLKDAFPAEKKEIQTKSLRVELTALSDEELQLRLEQARANISKFSEKKSE